MQHIKHIWTSIKDLSDDLGVPYTTAHSWSIRGRIPSDYDLPMIEAAKKRGAKLTLKELADARRSAAVGHNTHNALVGNGSVSDQPAPAQKGNLGKRKVRA